MPAAVINHLVADPLGLPFVVDPESRIVLFAKKACHECYGPLSGDFPKVP
jgi:hypothetical protein